MKPLLAMSLIAAAVAVALQGCSAEIDKPLPGGYRLSRVSGWEPRVIDGQGLVVIPKLATAHVGISRIAVVDELVVGRVWDAERDQGAGWFLLDTKTGVVRDPISELELNKELVARGKKSVPSYVTPGSL